MREPELLRPEHPTEPRLPAQVEALQLGHGTVRLHPLPRHHAGCELEGKLLCCGHVHRVWRLCLWQPGLHDGFRLVIGVIACRGSCLSRRCWAEGTATVGEGMTQQGCVTRVS